MTVQELIDELNKVEDKEKNILFDVNMRTYVGSIVDGDNVVYVTNLVPMREEILKAIS